MPSYTRRVAGYCRTFRYQMEHLSHHGYPGWETYPIQCPKNGGSFYFNFKRFYSIVWMALVDADNFIWVDIGTNGSASDADIQHQSELKEVVDNGTISFPTADSLSNLDRP